MYIVGACLLFVFLVRWAVRAVGKRLELSEDMFDRLWMARRQEVPADLRQLLEEKLGDRWEDSTDIEMRKKLIRTWIRKNRALAKRECRKLRMMGRLRWGEYDEICRLYGEKE